MAIVFALQSTCSVANPVSDGDREQYVLRSTTVATTRLQVATAAGLPKPIRYD